jgi:predicted  nucleic acid-binding Zn-ribbon protein
MSVIAAIPILNELYRKFTQADRIEDLKKQIEELKAEKLALQDHYRNVFNEQEKASKKLKNRIKKLEGF